MAVDSVLLFPALSAALPFFLALVSNRGNNFLLDGPGRPILSLEGTTGSLVGGRAGGIEPNLMLWNSPPFAAFFSVIALPLLSHASRSGRGELREGLPAAATARSIARRSSLNGSTRSQNVECKLEAMS